MDYMTLKETSEKWGVSVRQINYYCAGGRIPGAVKMAGVWLLPKDAEKPVDWTSEAVINVLDNAVKYSPRNSHITISIEKQHFYTLVKIKDEGIGIPQNEYNKIFQRFYRSNHSYVKQTEGSGVGLYLTRMILERQGGLIRVESVPEKGSTFILQFRN